MKYSLLELTQSILSSLDSDEVNSISDTTEARQVAEVIRTVYFNILTRANLPEHKELFQLTASGDADAPVLMIKPANISRVEWIKYNKYTDSDPIDQYEYVTILPQQQFLDMVQGVRSDGTDIDTFTLNGFTYYYRTDLAPSYCTIVDDYYFIFDSFNVAVDSTLQSSKTMCFGQTIPVFTMEDDFTPDLDEQQFPLLLNEAKALAFFELKQMPHQKAEQESQRQWRTLQRTKDLAIRPGYFDSLPNFGRKGNYAIRRFR